MGVTDFTDLKQMTRACREGMPRRAYPLDGRQNLGHHEVSFRVGVNVPGKDEFRDSE